MVGAGAGWVIYGYIKTGFICGPPPVSHGIPCYHACVAWRGVSLKLIFISPILSVYVRNVTKSLTSRYDILEKWSWKEFCCFWSCWWYSVREWGNGRIGGRTKNFNTDNLPESKINNTLNSSDDLDVSSNRSSSENRDNNDNQDNSSHNSKRNRRINSSNSRSGQVTAGLGLLRAQAGGPVWVPQGRWGSTSPTSRSFQTQSLNVMRVKGDLQRNSIKSRNNCFIIGLWKECNTK